MMNKRHFLTHSAGALAIAAAAPAALATPRHGLGSLTGQADWQAHLGRVFEVDGHAVTLASVDMRSGSQSGEQFSVAFQGQLPAGLNDGLRVLTAPSGERVALYLARTAGGLRADFYRLRS